MDLNIDMREPAPLKFQEMTAKYVAKDGVEGAFLIRNVTERGMGCECGEAPFAAGEEIAIDLPFLGMRTGIVRWTKDGNCGIEMTAPLDVDCLRLYSNVGPVGSIDTNPAARL